MLAMMLATVCASAQTRDTTVGGMMRSRHSQLRAANVVEISGAVLAAFAGAGLVANAYSAEPQQEVNYACYGVLGFSGAMFIAAHITRISSIAWDRRIALKIDGYGAGASIRIGK